MKAIIRSAGVAMAIATVVTLFAAALTQPIRAASPEEAHAGAPATTDHSVAGHDPSAAAPGQMPGMMQQHGPQMMQMHAKHAAMMGNVSASMPGQDAFGAIQEIVRMLEADPQTDWAKVNLEALRQHLIDMNEVTMNANAVQRNIPGGIEVDVTGAGRTVAAIRQMTMNHTSMLDKGEDYHASATEIPGGARLTITAKNASDAA